MVRAFVHALLFLSVLLFPIASFAQPAKANAVHVLGLDSEEAEDQADALTGALRSRARAQSGWTVSDNGMSLSMLTAALKCPQRPDPACLGRIGDQLKTDKFIWGLLSKSGKGQVTAEVHLWMKGKPDVMAKETFTDNLKDQNDENLRRIAARLFERLVVGQGGGTLTVKAGEGPGAVLIDGAEKGQLEHGQTTLELKPGTYQLEVRVPGYQPAKQTVTVSAGAESTLVLPLTAAPGGDVTPPPPPPPGGGEKTTSGGSGRKILGIGLITVGVVAAAIGVVEGATWWKKKGDLDDARDNNYGLGKFDSSGKEIAVVSDPCKSTAPKAADGCTLTKDTPKHAVIGWIAGGVGLVAIGAGAFILLTDKSSARASTSTGKASPPPRPMLTPYASPYGGGLQMAGSF